MSKCGYFHIHKGKYRVSILSMENYILLVCMVPNIINAIIVEKDVVEFGPAKFLKKIGQTFSMM